jgi:hypothetical protein
MQIWKASSTQSSKKFNVKTQWIFMLSPNKQMVLKQKTLVTGMCEDQTTNATLQILTWSICVTLRPFFLGQACILPLIEFVQRLYKFVGQRNLTCICLFFSSLVPLPLS